MQHDPSCRYPMPMHSDAAKRVSYTYNMHLVAGGLYGSTNVGKVIAVALADGRSDGTVYDNFHDAVYHQHHDEWFYAFIRINPSSMSPCAAEAFLKMRRLEYDAHLRLADRNHKRGGYQVIPRLNAEDQAVQEDIIKNGNGKFAIGYLD